MACTTAVMSVRPICKENRVDRRLAENQTGKRRVVVAFRQRKGRTLTFVARHEAEGVELAKRHVTPCRDACR